VTALLFALLYWKFGLGLELGMFLIYASLLIIIFVIDLENQLVLDKVIYPGMALAFVFSFFWPGIRPFPSPWLKYGVESALIGGVLGLAMMALPHIIYPRGMGLGDVKLGALIGLMTGYPLVFVAIFLSWISGGLIAAVLLALKIKGRKDPIPSATFLAVAAMVTLLWGQTIWQLYL
jgi:leader peptidase (prepilin peptidase)/N-methyltransferase